MRRLIGPFAPPVQVLGISSLRFPPARTASGDARTSMWEDVVLASGFFPLRQTANLFWETVFKLIHQINTSTQELSKFLKHENKWHFDQQLCC